MDLPDAKTQKVPGIKWRATLWREAELLPA